MATSALIWSKSSRTRVSFFVGVSTGESCTDSSSAFRALRRVLELFVETSYGRRRGRPSDKGEHDDHVSLQPNKRNAPQLQVG